MKKMSLPLCALALLAVAPVSVFAAEKNYDSEGVVQFMPGTDPTDPVYPVKPDPDKPVGPIDPVDPDGPKPGTDGPLSIDYASSFDFGLNKIANTNQVYYARAQQYVDDANGPVAATPNYVQISDNRGSNAGWTLSVKQNGQFSNASTLNKELTGSVITLSNPVIKSSASATVTAPIGAAADLNLDANGAASVVFSAKANAGAGTWVNAWGDENSVETVTEKDENGNDVTAEITKTVSLSVPGATPKDAVKYSTSLTWTLSDTPAV